MSNFKQVAVERSTNEDTKIEVIAWLKSQLTSVQPLMKQFGVTLNTEHDSDTHELTTTPSKLSQVLLNLIQNCTVHAFKSKHGNNLINISTREINNKLAIEIHDNGVGIPAESIDKIFDPFYTTNRSAGGTGLGLSIVHSIVTGELDGTITVESKENDGTHFTILLPLNNS